jgi:hypothetical protein
MKNSILMHPMEDMRRLARFSDLEELYPDASNGGHEEVGKVL